MLMQDAWSLTAFVNLAARQGQIRTQSPQRGCVPVSDRAVRCEDKTGLEPQKLPQASKNEFSSQSERRVIGERSFFWWKGAHFGTSLALARVLEFQRG